MENWAEITKAVINTKTAEIKEKEIRFYRIDEFKRNIKRVDEFSNTCPFCSNQKINIDSVVEKIDEAIQVPGQTRREYDRLISRLSLHMQKQHGFFAPWHFTYLYSFFGMVAGLLLGYFLQEIFPEYNWEMLSVGFAIGLVTSYIWGFMKDKKIRSEKRIM
jgi:hypothetical protein